MGALRQKTRHRRLWLAFAAVAVPLVVLLILQYRWLSDLQETSTVARKVRQQQYLYAVTDTLENIIRWEAERTLNPPTSLLGKPAKKAQYHFAKRPVPGSRGFFLIGLAKDSLEFIDPPPDERTRKAIDSTVWGWRMEAKKGRPLTTIELAANDTDPGARIVSKPLTDDSGMIVGVVGMVVDEDKFLTEAVPRALSKSLPGYPEDWHVHIEDDRGRPLWGQPAQAESKAKASRKFTFLFKDWRIILRSRSATPEQWARSNFLLNVSLSVVLAAALLGGLALALRAASRAIALSQMKSDFVSNVSHELRTPLASIRVFGELLRHGKVDSDAKIREYGEYIETEGRRLSQLINNILDFSKIESGQKLYRRQEEDLEALVTSTLETFRVRSRDSGQNLRYRGPEAPLPPVRLDPGAIGQALANLLDNAVKYSQPDSTIEVKLSARSGWAELTVEDQGIGIPRDQQAQIFDRFHRVSTGLVHDVKGSGLGLAIVRHVADAHGGRVSVDSEPGRGSRFTLHLPLGSGRSQVDAAMAAAQPASQPSS